MLLCWGQPSRRCFARIIPNGSGKTRSVVSRIGGRELDAFNGNVVKNLVIHSATLPRTKSSNLAKKAGVIRKQTDELRRFIPQPIFGKAKATLIKTKEMKFDSLFEINKFMIDDLPRCTTGNIADLMHISVKLTKKSKKISLLKNHLPLIASRLKEFPPSDWRFRDISTVVYGLQSFTENDEGVSSILSVMTELALQNISSKQPIKSQDISMMLLGLQCMSSRNEEIKKLLSAITTMISTCEESFDEQNIGNALHGLQSMNSDCTVVTLLLSALTIKIRDSESEISSQAVSNSLLGLQNMNSDSGEIRILISAIASKIRNCKPELSAVALSNSFYGLQGMSSDRAEVKDLLSALTVKAHHSVRRLNSNEISNAMFGLQRMRNDSVEVRDAVAVLAIKLKYSGAELSGHAVCSSLYGLQGMTSECTETRTLLSVLTTTLIGSKDRLSANDISNALYGLQDLREMIPKDAYLSTLRILYENVNRILYGDDGIIPVLDNIILNNLISLTESTTLILPQLNKILKQNHFKSWEKVNRLLSDELTARRRNGCEYSDENSSQNHGQNENQNDGQNEYLNDTENNSKNDDKNVVINNNQNDDKNKNLSEEKNSLNRINLIASKVFKGTEVMLKSNEYLVDLFKSDLVLRIPVSHILNNGEKSSLIFNIEIDNYSTLKNRGNNLNYIRRRDDFLESKGIIVLRKEHSSILAMSEYEIEIWLQNSLSNAKAHHTISMIGLSDEINAINAL